MMNVMQTKSVPVTMKKVVDAYRKVRANKGGGGVDGLTLKAYETDISKQLYKVWNRLTSGSYFPPEVRMVQIPKSDGKLRDLGIPTVGDRVAQQVIKTYLEPRYERLFSKSSYGYRPDKNAHQAIGQCQQDCWKHDWVIDLDIKGFFDNIEHEWMLRMLEQEVSERWVLMYIERWLKAPMQKPDGTQKERTKGTPQGGVISPLLANIYLHYVIDIWLERKNKGVTFQRYADDIVIHCHSKEAAQALLLSIKERLMKFGLELSEEKTKVVYCKRGSSPDRKEEQQKFTFFGHDFKPKTAKNRSTGKRFLGYVATIGQSAKTKMYQAFRSCNLHKRTDLSLKAIAEMINAKLRGWIGYYGKYGSNDLWYVFKMLNYRLLKWWKRKHKTGSIYKAIEQIRKEQQSKPQLFVHWQAGYAI
jgi:group II intron reverse transcriptase/maturase